MVALDGLEFARAGIAAVAVHDEGDVLGYGAAFEGGDEEFAELLDCPFHGREGEEPGAEVGAAGYRGHRRDLFGFAIVCRCSEIRSRWVGWKQG